MPYFKRKIDWKFTYVHTRCAKTQILKIKIFDTLKNTFLYKGKKLSINWKILNLHLMNPEFTSLINTVVFHTALLMPLKIDMLFCSSDFRKFDLVVTFKDKNLQYLDFAHDFESDFLVADPVFLIRILHFLPWNLKNSNNSFPG